MDIPENDVQAINFVKNLKAEIEKSETLSIQTTKTNGGDLRVRKHGIENRNFRNIITIEYQKTKKRFLLRSNIPHDKLNAYGFSIDRFGSAVLKNETFLPLSQLDSTWETFAKLLRVLDQDTKLGISKEIGHVSQPLHFNYRFIVFDLETTGFHFSRGHRIVEIGMVEVVNGEIKSEYHSYVNPERDIPEKVVEVHGVSNEIAATAPRFSEIVDDVCRFINSAPLVAHNAKFDIPFLKSEIEQATSNIWENPHLCTLKIAQSNPEIFTGKKTLDALCDHFQINRSHRVKHGALTDASLTAEVLIKMIDMELIDA